MTQPGQISHGMPPRDNDVWRAIRNLQRQVDQINASTTKALSRLPAVMTVGTVPITIPAGEVKATKTVTFANAFPAAPLVLAGCESAAYDGSANGFTAAGFTATARHSDGSTVGSDTTVTVVWMAVRL